MTPSPGCLRTLPARPPGSTSSACSPRPAGTTTRPPASPSAPSTSTNGSANTTASAPPHTPTAGGPPQHGGATGEPPRQYQSPLDIFERLGDQAGMAAGYHQ